MEQKHQDEIPATETETLRRIDAKAIRKWRLSRTIALIVMLVIFLIAYLLLWDRIMANLTESAMSLTITITSISAGVLILFQLLNLIVYPEIEYRQWSYCLTADRIEIKKGIIFHNTTIIPITRIQHVTVKEGPLARLYKLAKVEITTAGSTSEIDGLAVETAHELCDRMKNAVNKKVNDKKMRQASVAKNVISQPSKEESEIVNEEHS